MTTDTHVVKATTSIYPPEEEELIQSALRCLEARLCDGYVVSDSLYTKAYLQMQLLHELREVFAVVFLNTAQRIIAFEKLFFGTINFVKVHPRIVAQRALELNAAAVILVHNHPSNDVEPSSADKHATQMIKTALDMLDICLLDHIIVGCQGCCSFRERDLL